MSLTYCEMLDFDARGRAQRLALLELSDRDQALAQALHQKVLAPALERVRTEIVEKVRLFPEYRAIEAGLLERTIHSQLATWGVGVAEERYFEERLQLGLTHARWGVPFGVYQCAMRVAQQSLLRRLPALTAEHLEAALKVFTLDLSLAAETFQLIQAEDFRETVDAIQEQITADKLTGVLNRDHVMAVLKLKLRAAQRDGVPFCLVMADVDLFKTVNDRWGHLAGDAVLRDVAQRLKAATRDLDVIGRFGGEEFAILLESTRMSVAQQVAERVRERVASEASHYDGHAIYVTVSQGIAEATGEDTVESLIARADQALYEAKRAGRDRVVLSGRGLSPEGTVPPAFIP